VSAVRVQKSPVGQDDQEQREKVYRLFIIVLTGALVATLVAVVWLVQGKNSTQDDLDDAEEELASYTAGPDAQAAAEEILVVMTTYDYRETDDLAERWTKYIGNEDLKDQYEKQLVPDLVKVAKLTRTVAEGEVETSAYNLVDEDHVNVLAFVRQTIRSKEDPKGVLDEEWFSVDMEREGGEWLVEQIRPYDVPPPG
jgi:Mce-associated membrane protein